MAEPAIITQLGLNSHCVEERRFSKFDTDSRNNKFWNIYLLANDTVVVHFGPQGLPGQTKVFAPPHAKSGRKGLEKYIREKTGPKKGYLENEVVGSVQPTITSGRTIAKSELAAKAVAEIAKTQNPELTNLIKYFADVNAHNLDVASGGQIKYDASAGTFSTTQGVVTLSQIQKARTLLDAISECAAKVDFSSTTFKSLVNPYLSLIPQKGLVRQLHFPSLFSLHDGLLKQGDMLDALESSYASVLAASKTDDGKPVESIATPAMFRVDLEPIDAGKEFERIRNFYEDGKGKHSDVKNFAVKRCFKLRINCMTDAFLAQPWGKKEVYQQYNVWELWHGTKASNMLSILKAGFMIPPASAPHVCGRMYGDGCYASSDSTKALRYATGAWGGGGNVERKFMFLVKFAMGNYHIPTNSFRKLPAGFDSCWAKAGQSGVQNHEMIVYALNRIEPIRLVEFTPYGK